MKHISIDIETKSSIDIGKAGLYKYAQSGDFEVLLFAYSVDSAPVQIVDLACGEQIPDVIITALNDKAGFMAEAAEGSVDSNYRKASRNG